MEWSSFPAATAGPLPESLGSLNPSYYGVSRHFVAIVQHIVYIPSPHQSYVFYIVCLNSAHHDTLISHC